MGTTVTLAGQAAGPARAARERRRGDGPRGYKIIYNWDGAPHGYSEFPQSLEAFLDKTFAPLKDTQVGALFWCLGEHEATWNSKTLPVVGELNVYGNLVRGLQASEYASHLFGERACAQ